MFHLRVDRQNVDFKRTLPVYSLLVSEETEESLVERSRGRDADAFARLVIKYRATVFRWAMGVVNRSEDAQDVVQEVFLRVFRGLPEYRGESKFSVWLYRITYNMSVNWLARKREDLVPFEEELHSVPKREPAISTGEMQKELDNLPAHYRVVLVLYYFRGMNYSEVARTLGVPINTVKTHLRRAKRILGKRMASG